MDADEPSKKRLSVAVGLVDTGYSDVGLKTNKRTNDPVKSDPGR
jgi:hypothetical protein